MELPFVFLRYIFFSDSLKVFGFLVTLLNIIGKKVIFSKISYFQLQYLFCCCLVYKQHIYCANLVQKFKIVSLSWNLAPRITQICRIQWWCFLFCFRLEIPFLGKFGSFPPKNSQFKLKFGTKLNSNMQNSMVIFTSSIFDRKYLFLQIWFKNSKLSV